MPRARQRLKIGGTVQGVGFRPFVYSVATRLGLGGFVLNDSSGVVIEIEGPPGSLEAFGTLLRADQPPLATIATLQATDIEVEGSSSFEIRTSEAGAEAGAAAIAPDVATCPACLEEVLDPSERRHGYAFTNCTNCGPRFTITTGIPYDRVNTTMAPFVMCERCRSEYEDPRDRRFHAQPIACPRCGPTLALCERDGRPASGDPLSEAVRRLNSGAIVAVKGLGGYHLACDASNDDAVSELRVRKAREEKPFAVMVPTLEWACRLANTSSEETAALASRRRPIVLVERREEAGLAPSIAPGNRHLGLMLPYTPLHHLLLRKLGSPLVLTSGNLSDEPIINLDEDAFEGLGAVADAFLTHDRAIHTRCDDSVVRVLDGVEYPIRRARGYAPEPLRVAPPFGRPVLAAGPELKHTFCLGAGDRALVSHHIGDLESYSALQAFAESVELWKRIWRIRPEVVAHDLHPEYLSTKWALEVPDVERIGVQHHHAHVAACLADAGRTERVIGLALDGTGLGEDGAIWGGEVLACDLARYERLAHLEYVPMPGGTAAIREPWRMAAVYLRAAFGDEAGELDLEFVHATRKQWAPVVQDGGCGPQCSKDIEHGEAVRRGGSPVRGSPASLVRGPGGGGAEQVSGHEVGLCEAIMEAVERRAAGRSVNRVKVRVGVRHRVVESSFDEAFSLVSGGTVAEDAEIDLAMIPARVTCSSCGQQSNTDDVFAVCTRCGSSDLEIEGGDDLMLESIEVGSNESPASAQETS